MYVTFPVSRREFLKAQEDKGERDPKSIKVRIRFRPVQSNHQLGVVIADDIRACYPVELNRPQQIVFGRAHRADHSKD
jgi:hypothetical protein